MISRALLVLEPILYGVLLLPVAYLMKLHGKPGFLWSLYLTLFSLLHVIGGVMLLCDSKHAMTILNICIGLLILATSAVWFELNHHWETNKAIEKIKVAIIHILVIAGELLLILGAITDPVTAKTSVQVKIGIGLGCLAVAAKLMLIQAIVAIVEKACSWKDDKSRLLFATTFGSVCLCVRIIYTMCVMTRMLPLLSRCATNMQGVYFVLLPETLTAIVYLAVGLWTRNIGESRQEEPEAKEDIPDSNEQAPPPTPPQPRPEEFAWDVTDPGPNAPRPSPDVAELEAEAVEPRQNAAGTGFRQPEVYELDDLDPFDEWQNIPLAS
ncbi:integral membrane protein [Fusarium flagelliforme]|uniref:Integral membrane protein n=1 Tax=Fusarium flagelliforme TaxID=2675880 RepID=A0A395MIB4_9HYPO|nr:integral membrane protein [Fusarium flagelliforme]